MKTLQRFAVLVMLVTAASAVRADDTTISEDRVTIKVNKERIKEDARNTGNKLTNFFVHTIGDPLKSSARKVRNTLSQ